MTLAPLLTAPLVIQIHALMALLAVALTVTLFSLPKGSRLHRSLGWTWVIFMALVALSSFWIVSDWGILGPFGPIHLLSVLVLHSLFFAVRAARAHNVKQHRRIMTSLAFWGLGVTGAVTLIPGRLMHAVLIGS
ncbi:MAG: DUF2306 domain-containing protein [Pseudomonadota bacterium]